MATSSGLSFNVTLAPSPATPAPSSNSGQTEICEDLFSEPFVEYVFSGQSASYAPTDQCASISIIVSNNIGGYNFIASSFATVPSLLCAIAVLLALLFT